MKFFLKRMLEKVAEYMLRLSYWSWTLARKLLASNSKGWTPRNSDEEHKVRVVAPYRIMCYNFTSVPRNRDDLS